MYEIYFDNSEIVDATHIRMCQMPDYQSALAVFDALTKKFLCVNLYDCNTVNSSAEPILVRSYSNL